MKELIVKLLKRKKRKKQNISPVVKQEIHVDIDYEKLAAAVINAQKSVNEADSSISKTFATITGLLFYITSVTGMVFSTAACIFGIRYEIEDDIGNSVCARVCVSGIVLVITSILFLFSLLLFKSAQELEHEKDRQFIVSIFSAVVGFAALIVAFIALMA